MFLKQHARIHESSILLVTCAGNEGLLNANNEFIAPYCREICPPWRENDIRHVFKNPLEFLTRICEEMHLKTSPKMPTAPCKECIHVGAHTHWKQQICDFSSGGCSVDIVALGSAILLEQMTTSECGTSYATAVISGAMSHILPLIPSAKRNNPKSMPNDVKQLLKETADKIQCKWLGTGTDKHKQHEVSLALNFVRALQHAERGVLIKH